MLIMSGAMHIVGLMGAPRRSAYSEYGGTEQATDWIGYQIAQAVGGTILFIGILLMVYIFIKLAFLDRKSTRLNSSHVAISYAGLFLKKKLKMFILLYSLFYLAHIYFQF